MPSSHAPPSPNPQPTKRQRQSSTDHISPTSPTIGSNDAAEQQSPTQSSDHHNDGAGGNNSQGHGGQGKVGQGSNFRNVSACNRCRLRKNRCDQKLPSCNSCAKAGVACVGYDPITKKQIPRSYVFYLEMRVEQLESLLAENNIQFPPADNLELCSRSGSGPKAGRSKTETGIADEEAAGTARNHAPAAAPSQGNQASQTPSMPNFVSPAKPGSLAQTSGVSFARVVRAAVQYTLSDQVSNSDKLGQRQPGSVGAGVSMRDNFFGLHTKPSIRPAPFPDKEQGLKLVRLYFEHANPQIPILHRVEFMDMFEQAYAKPASERGPRELYTLNMVFAVGSGVIVDDGNKSDNRGGEGSRANLGQVQAEPEEYHASAIVHLESCLGNSGGGMEVLQAVLLLANFALLRPVPPGLWYIAGVALRVAVEEGLHFEDGESPLDLPTEVKTEGGEPQVTDAQRRERGKRLYIRDMRRRLWWCTYAFDRLVSTCIGRPFGISDQVITTELPSVLDDKYITKSGFLAPPPSPEPCYKRVAYHYLKLRFLQSEILQVLQYKQTQIARAHGQNIHSPEMHIRLPSPFLIKFDSFRSWRIDIDRRLYQWKATSPTREQTGVAFSTDFLELNYWQAIILLYRQSLSVPAMFEGEYHTSKEVNSPQGYPAELKEDEDRIYLKVAEAGQKIIRLYRGLHLSGLVSYTYLSTHHLFMAGITYLYAIWYSPIVRSRLSMEEVDFTVLAAKSVFTDMIDKCTPAERCRDAFDRTAKATIKMANQSGGFGAPASRKRRTNAGASTARDAQMDWTSADSQSSASLSGQTSRTFNFDMMPDNLSSPALSAAGEGPVSPQLPRSKTFEGDGFGLMTQPQSALSPSDASLGGDVPPIDPSLLGTPTMGRSMTGQQGSAFLPTSFAPGSAEYADSQTIEFLQSLQGTTPTGEFGGLDPLGFGLNWDGGISQEFGEGQPVSLFDGFFFGGQGQ